MNQNKPYNRLDRVNKQVLDILSGILHKDIDLSHLGFITFTKVIVSNDLRNAKVFYSIINETMTIKAIDIELNKHRKPFKKYMSPQLKLKSTPDLKFYHDDTLEYTEYVSKLMKNLDIRDN